MTESLPLQHQLKLAKAVGDFMKYWGFKSIHGRIWCLRDLSNKPRDAQYFIDQLNVSKALISLAIKDLMKYKVITKVEVDPPSIFHHYTANPEILNVILDVLRDREMKMLENVQTFANNLDCSDNKSIEALEIDKARLTKLKSMTDLAYFTLQDIFDEEFESKIGLDKILK